MDFHDFTSADQFDQKKIFLYAKLEAIPHYRLLRGERDYLEAYRKLLAEKIELKEEDLAISADEEITEQPKKKAKKATKPEIAEE